MLNLYCVMTENCNLQCEHCYLSARPGKESTTVSSKKFEKMLTHLPIIRTEISLTGGEIFTVEDRLKEYLDLIGIENEKRNRYQKIEIELQTNGFWLQRKNARDLLLELKGKKVRSLDIASNDKHHKKQGLELDYKLIKLAREYISEVGFRGVEKPLPIGRASQFPKQETKKSSFIDGECKYANENKNWDVTVWNTGKIYPCCFPFFEYPGNVFQEDLLTILNRAKINPRLQALEKRGLRGIAEYDGFNAGVIDELINEYGSCGACVELYGRGLKC